MARQARKLALLHSRKLSNRGKKTQRNPVGNLGIIAHRSFNKSRQAIRFPSVSMYLGRDMALGTEQPAEARANPAAAAAAAVPPVNSETSPSAQRASEISRERGDKLQWRPEMESLLEGMQGAFERLTKVTAYRQASRMGRPFSWRFSRMELLSV
jgi:hypothetical protein